MITVDTILGYLKDCVENKIPVGPDVWLEAAQKLVVLLEDESDKLCEYQQEVAQARVKSMEEGATAAKAKIFAEALPVYRNMQKQRARIEQIQEMVRIAKLQAKMKTEEMRAYG